MAIRINAATDLVRRNANAPLNTSFTYMADFIIFSDLGSAVDQVLFASTITAYSEAYGVTYESASADGAMRLFYVDAGASTPVSFPSRPELNRPFCLYMRCSGSGANLFTGGWCYPGGPWVTATSTLPASVTQTTRIEIGAFASAFYTDCMFQNFKIWDVPLSDAELIRERDSANPVSRLEYLNLYAPCPHHNDGFDRGPKGRHLERAATLSTGYFDFKRPGKPLRKPVPYEAPAGGVFQILAGPRFSLAGAHGLAGD